MFICIDASIPSILHTDKRLRILPLHQYRNSLNDAESRQETNIHSHCVHSPSHVGHDAALLCLNTDTQYLLWLYPPQ